MKINYEKRLKLLKEEHEKLSGTRIKDNVELEKQLDWYHYALKKLKSIPGIYFEPHEKERLMEKFKNKYWFLIQEEREEPIKYILPECGQVLIDKLQKRDLEIQEELKFENAREHYKEYLDWYCKACEELNKIPDICFDDKERKEIVEHFEKQFLNILTLIQGGKNESN